MNLLCLEVATEQELFNVYIKILARILGSEEEAKKRIYLVSCGDSYGFGVELDQKERYKLSAMGEVMLAFPDCCYHVRNMNRNVQSAASFTPFNRNHQYDNIFSYHHLSNWNSQWSHDHWLINIKQPDGGFNNRKQLTNFCIQMLAEVVGSKQLAKKKIYIVWFTLPFGFAVETDKETSNRLRGLPGVLKVLPDYAFDTKDHPGVLRVSPSYKGLRISHYGMTKECDSRDCNSFSFMKFDSNSKDLYQKEYDWRFDVRSVPQSTPINLNDRVNDIFSYHHLSECNSEWNFDHWLIHIKQLDEGFKTKKQTIEFCSRMLAEVFGSDEEDARKKIYIIWCKMPFGFGAEIDKETSNKLKGLPDVLIVLPDYAFDVQNRSRETLVISPSCLSSIWTKMLYYPPLDIDSDYDEDSEDLDSKILKTWTPQSQNIVQDIGFVWKMMKWTLVKIRKILNNHVLKRILKVLMIAKKEMRVWHVTLAIHYLPPRGLASDLELLRRPQVEILRECVQVSFVNLRPPVFELCKEYANAPGELCLLSSMVNKL